MDATDEDFQKADIILAEALEKFNESGISPYVYGSALMEIGIAALVKVGEDETSMLEQVKQIISQIKPVMTDLS